MVTIITATHGANNGTTLMHEAGPSDWREASVVSIAVETPTVKSFTFAFGTPIRHLPGQHYEIRLTGENGYQAARLYSAASVAAGDNHLQLTIALLPGGEISPYMHDQVRPGDKVEIRGPLGKFFVWRPDAPEPVLLVGGGSGVVPLRCMMQAHQAAHSAAAMKLVYSARSYEEIIYKPELLGNADTTITISGETPAGWAGMKGRISPVLLQRSIDELGSNTVCYVCGATPFVEAMADVLVQLGVPPARIKTERFGAAATSSR